MTDVGQRPSEGDHRLHHSHLFHTPQPAHAPASASTAHFSAHHYPIPAPRQKPTLHPISGTSSPATFSRPHEYSLPAQTPTTGGQRTDGSQMPYPSPNPQEVSMDSLSRLQTQVRYNTAGLQTQRMELESLIHAVSRLSDHMVRIESLVVSLEKEHLARPIAPIAPSRAALANNIDDAMLERFADNLNSVTIKVNEVDALKIQLQIVNRRVKIMEEAVATARPPPNSAAESSSAGLFAAPWEGSQTKPPHPMQYALHPRHAPPPPALHHQELPSYASPPILRLDTPSHVEICPGLRSAPIVQNCQFVPQEMHSISKPGSQSSQQSQNSAWILVNPSVKRQHPNGMDSVTDGRREMIGSPKRPKLAPLAPHVEPEPAPASTPMRYDPIERDRRDHHTEAMHEQQQYPAAPPIAFVPYNPNEQPRLKNNWHSESQSTASPAGKELRRGGGGGRGRGGRSLPADSRGLGTPQCEKPGYQAGRDGHYHLEAGHNGIEVPRASNIERCGSGDNGRSAIRQYVRAKKTRTKPVRNADGILIRKDGRPDMRSQSSATNLRTFCAQKEHKHILRR
ncbi:hypothetical protein MPH_13493 [Macrophomina phaseolina MS6]|uniref:Uncharacterized protein n=1 Tax=Macrophomina phaseolina (strain MS6) TaxID=1126212 RepID=K2R5M3_MACPH|nr:hypothetical protein MPH_13493 [Macrophomina phaseolina MS6]